THLSHRQAALLGDHHQVRFADGLMQLGNQFLLARSVHCSSPIIGSALKPEPFRYVRTFAIPLPAYRKSGVPVPEVHPPSPQSMSGLRNADDRPLADRMRLTPVYCRRSPHYSRRVEPLWEPAVSDRIGWWRTTTLSITAEAVTNSKTLA